jgi:hypothetical protein
VIFEHACRLGLEGVIAKRKGSAYRSGRCGSWLKVKNPRTERASPSSSRKAALSCLWPCSRTGRLASGGKSGEIKLWPKDGKGKPAVLDHGSWVSPWPCSRTGGWLAAARAERSSSGERSEHEPRYPLVQALRVRL